MKPKIGVLSLQGCFLLHRDHLLDAQSEYCEVRRSEELKNLDGLILPGGESTTMLKHIQSLELESELKKFIQTKPTWAICAGVILIAKNVKNPKQDSLKILDIEVTRNSYGRQLNSFEEEIQGEKVSFIRAPIINSLGKKITTLHSTRGNPTWIEQSHLMATTFHPELSRITPSFFHKYFVNKVQRFRHNQKT